MSRILLALAILLAAPSMVGCSKKKKNQSMQGQINQCMFDPTGECQRRAAALSQVPGYATAAINYAKNNPQVLAQVPPAQQQVTATGSNSNSTTEIMRKAAQVRAELSATGPVLPNHGENAPIRRPSSVAPASSSGAENATANNTSGGSGSGVSGEALRER